MVYKMKILIVEDNDLLRKLILDSLTHHFPKDEVITFQNGEDAVEEIKKESMDVAVLDIHLPGMNGLKITRMIRNLYQNAFIIIYTNYSFKEYRENAITSGVDHFLSKDNNSPADLARLIKKAKEKI